MTAPALYVFTDRYPFGDAEQFLEQELEYLQRGFSQVTVVPARRMVDPGEARPLPDGVRLDLDFHRIPDSRHPADAIRIVQESFERAPRSWSLDALTRLESHLKLARRARRWLRQGGLEAGAGKTILYTYWLGGTTNGLGSVRRDPRLLLVSRAHRGDLYEEVRSPAYLPLLRPTIGRVDRLFLISEHGRRYVAERWPRFADKAVVARLGVPEAGSTTPASSDGILRLASCSFISEVKRIPLLIEGIRRFALDHPEVPVAWRHLGDGPGRQDLERLAAARLPANVDGGFLGRLPEGGVLDHYRTHPVDVFLNVSRSEGVPVSIMEAQSFGIPAVATAVGGTPEIVNDENGVLLSASPTPEEIAAAIERVRSEGLERRLRTQQTSNDLSRADMVYPRFVEQLLELVQ